MGSHIAEVLVPSNYQYISHRERECVNVTEAHRTLELDVYRFLILTDAVRYFDLMVF